MRLLPLLLLTGCSLIDQQTFNPRAGEPPVVPAPPATVVAPVVPGPAPLLVVAAGAVPSSYAGPLGMAVQAARARKAEVIFDVVEMQAPDVASETVGGQAAAVARAIVAQGVVPGRVRLAVRPDASATPREVRVYVR